MAKNKKQTAAILLNLNDLRQQVATLQSQLLSPHAPASKPAHRRNAHQPDQTDEIKVFELRESNPNSTSSNAAFTGLFDEACLHWLSGDYNFLTSLSLSNLEKEPARHLLATLHASALLSTGDNVRARKALSRAIAWGLDPKHGATLFLADAHRHLASAYAAKGNYSKATKHTLLARAGRRNNTTIPSALASNKGLPNSAEKSERGQNLMQDIALCLTRYSADIIFDVGANVGQSSIRFLETWPNCRVYSFEPSLHNFQELKRQHHEDLRLTAVNCAVSDRDGTATLHCSADSTMTHLYSSHPDAAPFLHNYSEQPVSTITLDTFCATNHIRQIDFLKVDTEGHDLAVLQGAAHLLQNQAISIIQVEAGMNLLNPRHQSLEALKSFVEKRGYFLFGIYEQSPEWITQQPQLRRANLVFISSKLIEQVSGHGPQSAYDAR